MVGISVFEPGALVAGRYRVVERLTRFAVVDQAITGVEFEYWLAVDESRGTEVWLQAAASGGSTADGATLAGAVAAIRRLNHPALPIVLDFGEIEIEIEVEVERAEAYLGAAGAIAAEAEVEVEIEDEIVDEVSDAVFMDAVEREALAESFVRRIGYTVLAPVEGESLAAVLLRGVLAEVELLAVLAEVAEVLELLHETELVHAHLSPYSIVLTETGVMVIDLAVALAVEAAADSELTVAADVYALAWLACVALVGFEVIELEFGAGFVAAAAAGELVAEGMSLELIARRRRWAEANLVAGYGMSAELAALLVAGLGEAAVRPEAGELTAAFRGRPIPAPAKRGRASAAAELAAGGGIFVGAVAARAAMAGGVAAQAEDVIETEYLETDVVETGVVETGGMESGAVGAGAGAGFGVGAGIAAGVGVGVGVGLGIEAAGGMSVAEMGMAAPTAPPVAATAAAASAPGSVSSTADTATIARITAETANARTGTATAGAGAGVATAGAGVAAGFAAGGLIAEESSATSETMTIPRVIPRGSGSGRSGSGSGTGSGKGSGPGRSPSGPVGSPSGPVGPMSPVSSGLSGSSASSGRHAPKRRRAGILLPLALGLAIVLVVGVIWALVGTNKKVSPTAATNAVATTTPAAVQTTQASNLGQVVLPTVTPTQSSVPTGTVTIVPTIPEGTPLATPPSSPSQALQQIQGLVNQSSSGLSSGSLAALKGALAIVQQELNSGGSIGPGVTALRQVLVQNGFPAGLAGQINEIIPYLNNAAGS